MIFNFEKFLRDYHIEYLTEGSRARAGWIQIQCPFCSGSSRGWDLGFCIDDGRISCWQCRGKTLNKTIQQLLRCSGFETKRIILEYGGEKTRPLLKQNSPVQVGKRKRVDFPLGTVELQPKHRDYLIGRNFDPDLLERIYGLKGTGPLGDYKFRIIAPVILDGKMVSYQGRDVTGKSDLRYKACPLDLEVVHHKHTLYGIDLVKGDSVAVVEGITDVWRLGPGAVATFGTGFTKRQANTLIQRFKRVYLLFDPEPKAQQVAEELSWVLGNVGIESYIIDLESSVDPGDMKQDDADNLMKELGLFVFKDFI